MAKAQQNMVGIAYKEVVNTDEGIDGVHGNWDDMDQRFKATINDKANEVGLVLKNR